MRKEHAQPKPRETLTGKRNCFPIVVKGGLDQSVAGADGELVQDAGSASSA